jgi:hypothetical protein
MPQDTRVWCFLYTIMNPLMLYTTHKQNKHMDEQTQENACGSEAMRTLHGENAVIDWCMYYHTRKTEQ